MAGIERIDLHTHAVTPGFREYCQEARLAGKGKPDGMPAIPEWSPQTHIALMDRLHISRSILSISSPGTNLSPDNAHQARELTRRTNIELADICKAYPERFNFFASLPLPDVEGSLEEIDYALDHLGAVGFQILTNAHGVYPGDARLDPVFDLLSTRKAVVFLHPTSCHIVRTGGVGSGESGSASVSAATVVETVNPIPHHPAPMLEFMFDTTRAISNLLLCGTAKRCAGITFLACHCGAVLPPVLERVAAFSRILGSSKASLTADEAKSILRSRFYFDLAGFPFPDQIQGLLRQTDASRLVYGSDYPYTPAGLVEDLARRMDEEVDRLFREDEQKQIYHGNARKILEEAAVSQMIGYDDVSSPHSSQPPKPPFFGSTAPSPHETSGISWLHCCWDRDIICCYRIYHDTKAIKGKAKIIGLSLGAIVAIDLASQFPDRVDEAIFVSRYEIFANLSDSYAPYALWTMNQIERLVPRAMAKWLMDGAHIRVASQQEDDNNLAFLCRDIIKAISTKHHDDHPHDTRKLAQIGRMQNPKTFAVMHPLMRHQGNRRDQKLFAGAATAWFEVRELPDGFREL
ncbi:hypothetical protein VTN77DRAFT_6648 [Rasamsonia byssochlamydoides]|uniref:uncharacterized protein n=1 Tax=Rasamsonia byssochlamydoides TaxID=89139 RepID=UPI003742AE31